MNFFMPIKPPTVTAQEKKVAIVKGKPVFYNPPEVKLAKQKLLTALTPHKLKKPLTGPLKLTVIWMFEGGQRHAEGEWRSTRPDTDNLQKMLKDCMTEKGYWKDDAQVSVEIIKKKWTRKIPGISISIEELGGKK